MKKWILMFLLLSPAILLPAERQVFFELFSDTW
jgi:hypothetical protein